VQQVLEFDPVVEPLANLICDRADATTA